MLGLGVALSLGRGKDGASKELLQDTCEMLPLAPNARFWTAANQTNRNYFARATRMGRMQRKTLEVNAVTIIR
jgi:hypothetical protein